MQRLEAVHLSLHKMALVIHVSSPVLESQSGLQRVFLQVTNLNTDTPHTLVFSLLCPTIAANRSKRMSDI